MRLICWMMAAQHQHYVAQLLLRGFLSQDPAMASKEQVHVLDLESGKSFPSSISNIMGERRFNDFWLDDETRATIEPAAGRIESHVAPLIERIRAEKRLLRTEDELVDLALLMAFQFMRTKWFRQMPERLASQLRAIASRMGFDPAKVKGIPNLDEEGLKLEHVRSQVRNFAEFTKLIADKEFLLMAAPEGSTFYLGDNPVVMHNDEEKRVGPFARLGLGVPYIQIYLPLSADVTLCAWDKALLGQLMRTRDEEMAQIRIEAFDKLTQREITAQQMKQALDAMKSNDRLSPMIDAIRAGEAIPIGVEQVEHYNWLQASQAHRFVVDPDGKFDVASAMLEWRRNTAKVRQNDSTENSGDT